MIVPAKSQFLLSSAGVENLYCLVSAAGCDPLAIGAKGDAPDFA